MKILGRVVAIVLVVAVLAVVGILFYSNTVMRGDRAAALEAWENPAVTITSTDHSIVISPTGETTGAGLVFIPGAKVDPYAYLYKLSGIVEQSGATVVITKPTLNLAFFDTRPLSVFEADAPDVTRWFVGGHSLGGVRACQLAGTDGTVGLVLFGSYCANDLSGSGLEVLSISGSNDGLSTPSKIDEAKHLLPENTNFVQIEGLNHAGFGDYGYQSGDGVSTLTDAEERTQITDQLRSLFDHPR